MDNHQNATVNPIAREIEPHVKHTTHLLRYFENVNRRAVFSLLIFKTIFETIIQFYLLRNGDRINVYPQQLHLTPYRNIISPSDFHKSFPYLPRTLSLSLSLVARECVEWRESSLSLPIHQLCRLSHPHRLHVHEVALTRLEKINIIISKITVL